MYMLPYYGLCIRLRGRRCLLLVRFLFQVSLITHRVSHVIHRHRASRGASNFEPECQCHSHSSGSARVEPGTKAQDYLEIMELFAHHIARWQARCKQRTQGKSSEYSIYGGRMVDRTG